MKGLSAEIMRMALAASRFRDCAPQAASLLDEGIVENFGIIDADGGSTQRLSPDFPKSAMRVQAMRTVLAQHH